MKLWRRLALGLSSWIVLSVGASADTVSKIAMKDLERQGIYPRTFSIFHVADDGRTILGAEEPPFTDKAKGNLSRLWLIKLTPDFKIESARGFGMNVPSLEQANFTPDRKSVILSSKRGSDIHLLDLESGKLNVLMTHQEGVPGFRIHSNIFSLYAGKLYTIGYFYDAEDYAGDDEMVEIDVSKVGQPAFTSVLKIHDIQKQIKNIKISSTLHPAGLLYYTQDEGGGWSVYQWNVSGGLQKIDQGQVVLGSWGEGASGLYSIKRNDGSCEVILRNAQTGSQTSIYTGKDSLVNPCLGKDANTLVIAKPGTGNDVEYWVGQDTNQFQLRKVAEKLPASTLRVSHDGSVVCIYNGLTGLTLVKLDQ